MPTNVFFSPKVSTEQFMYEDIIIESIKMYGQDVYYLPRKIMQRDFILGEDAESQFNTANVVEMFIENTEGFEGEGNIFAKFGMEIRDEVTFIVARRSWSKTVGMFNSDINGERPMEGDLIYLPLSKSFFEVSYVEHEAPFYQLSNLPVFKLQARMFEFNDEEFNTGIAELDGIESDHGYQEQIEYGSKVGTFQAGERIKYISVAASASGVTPVVVEVNISAQLLSSTATSMTINQIETTDGEYKQFAVGNSIVGITSGATATITAVYDVANSATDSTFLNDLGARNFNFEDEADDIIDFSESNPFGDAT
tara:strand:+ start:561 stop:1490 length:930 start_codon:yes stop_codon:yes gene_type:complete